MTAIVQEQDAENAVQALIKLGFSVTRLPTKGGFLQRKNVTLMVGMAAGLEDSAVRTLKSSCRERIEFVSTLFPVSNLPMPKPIEVKVGGATIFVFEVESYTEL